MENLRPNYSSRLIQINAIRFCSWCWHQPVDLGFDCLLTDQGATINLQAVLLAFGKTNGVDYQINDLLSMPAITAYSYDNQGAFNAAVVDVNENEIMETPCEEDPLCLCELSRHWAWVTYGIDCSDQRVMYWYHPDYLGNTEYITDWSGNPYQYFWYSPWGESLEDQHKYQSLANPPYNYYDSPYAFNGKEFDFETGNYYYGARYYNPKYSIWLSVDPKAHWYPAHSPYNYTLNNPINLVDPNGKWVKGAGFWNNLFNNDEKAEANKIARGHKNAEVIEIDGGYKVCYRSENKDKTVGDPDEALDQNNQIFIFKNTKRYGVYKSLAHMLDANFQTWMRGHRSSLSTLNGIAEDVKPWTDGMAIGARDMSLIWNPVVALPNSVKTISKGENLFGEKKEGTFDRYVRPTIGLLAPPVKAAPQSLRTVNVFLKLKDTGERSGSYFTE